MIELVFRYDPDANARESLPADAAAARALLEGGNRTFADLSNLGAAREHASASHVIPITGRDLGLPEEGTDAPSQAPFALVLGCADARVPLELVFLKGANDLFVLRVAGHVLGESVLGSIDWALQNLHSVRLVVVLGHTGCGAVAAAADAFVDPADYLALAANHQLRGIVNNILPAVRVAHEGIASVHGIGARKLPGFRAALAVCAVPINAAIVATTLHQEVRAAGRSGVDVVWGVYDIATRRIGLRIGDREVSGLRDPLGGAEEFDALARELASQEIVAGLLAGT